MNGGTDADRALVVRNLGDVVGDRTERPLAEGLRGSEVSVEDVALGVVVGPIGGVELLIERSGQVISVREIRDDRFRLERPVVVAEVREAIGAQARTAAP